MAASMVSGYLCENKQLVSSRRKAKEIVYRLAYQSLGVIYGDIGTSPLYVFSSTFSDNPSQDDVLGATSLIIWALTIMVTIKYVVIVLNADDEGEGGTFALYSLISRYVSWVSSGKHQLHSRRWLKDRCRPIWFSVTPANASWFV